MARATWKGVLRIADEAVPVKLYSAVEDRTVHFRLLHAADGVPVRQQMVDSETGEPVDNAEARKGFEVEEGLFVLLEESELDAIEPERSRDIELLRFLPEGSIDHLWYERPYHLGPDDGAETDYVALAEALARRKREGVARWVMRNRPYVGALRSDGRHLRLIALRHAEEVVPASALQAPGGRELDERELTMAGQLVAMLEGRFDPAAYRDEYRERVLELVERKAEGKVVELRRPTPRLRPESLSDALAASIDRAKKERRSA